MSRVPVNQRKLVIRSFRAADYDAVAEIWQLGDIGVDTREQIRTRLRRDRDLFLVAEIAGRVVGTVMGGWDGRRASLWRMAVHPDYRRAGVGTALIRELESRARSRGATSMFLFTGGENSAAQRLYELSGFSIGEDMVSMWKRLDPPKDPDR